MNRQGRNEFAHTDLSLGVDVAWHDADLALAWLDDSRAVRSNQAGLRADGCHVLLGLIASTTQSSATLVVAVP